MVTQERCDPLHKDEGVWCGLCTTERGRSLRHPCRARAFAAKIRHGGLYALANGQYHAAKRALSMVQNDEALIASA